LQAHLPIAKPRQSGTVLPIITIINLRSRITMTQSIELYSDLMDKARAFAVELSLKPDVASQNQRLPSRKDLVTFLERNIPGPGHLAYNCLYVGSIPPQLDKLGFNGGEVTIGYMKFNNEDEYFTTKELLAKELSVPKDKAIDLHVWLTFPGGKIFDPTLLASFEKDTGKVLDGQPIDQYTIYDHVGIKSINVEMEYIPLLVGSDYLYKIKAIVVPNPEFNLVGAKAADQAFGEAILKGFTLCLTDIIVQFREVHPENWDAVVVGLVDRFDQFIASGHMVKTINGKPREIYYSATDAGLAYSREP